MRLAGFYLCVVVVVLLPMVFPNNYFVTVVGISAGLHAILAVGLNLLMGYAGQISLGHAAFFGMGAYSSAILTTRFAWPGVWAMLAGLMVTAVLAWGAGPADSPAARPLSGDGDAGIWRDHSCHHGASHELDWWPGWLDWHPSTASSSSAG